MHTYQSIITLNINSLNAPIKKIGQLNGSENKTHIYAVYKRPSSEQKIQTKSKETIVQRGTMPLESSKCI